MKYDVEYDSYKFSNDEVGHIVAALRFYLLYGPVEENSVVLVDKLIDSIKDTKNILIR